MIGDHLHSCPKTIQSAPIQRGALQLLRGHVCPACLEEMESEYMAILYDMSSLSLSSRQARQSSPPPIAKGLLSPILCGPPDCLLLILPVLVTGQVAVLFQPISVLDS